MSALDLPAGVQVLVHATAEEAGRAAGREVAAELRRRLADQSRVRVIFAAGPSQRFLLETLRTEPDIDWYRISAFHMDEYLQLPEDAPQRWGLWLRTAHFDHLPFGEVNLIRTDGDAQQCADEYAGLLAAEPIDLVCFGIGVNGHLAFNDPSVADFDDAVDMKVVELDQVCRQQQVDDGEFATVDDVPRPSGNCDDTPTVARWPHGRRGERCPEERRRPRSHDGSGDHGLPSECAPPSSVMHSVPRQRSRW